MEKAMAPHSSTLAWKIPWMDEPGGLQSMGSLELGTSERLHFHFSLSCIGEGNGNPLQYSCLENPRDGGAWWAAVYGVTQSRTRLKWLSNSNIDSSGPLLFPSQNILCRSPYIDAWRLSAFSLCLLKKRVAWKGYHQPGNYFIVANLLLIQVIVFD